MNITSEEPDLLDIKGLEVAYPLESGFVPVFRDLNLRVGRGEIVGLCGPSGSGKTTLALAIMGLLPAPAIRSGEILFAGVDLLRLTRRQMTSYRGRRLGLVFQEPESAFNPLQQLGTQLVEAIRCHFPQPRNHALDWLTHRLHELGMPAASRLLRAYPQQVSVGELQRLQLAGALACQPELLICDEPTAAVDAPNRLRLLALLKDLPAAGGLALLVISHDRNLLLSAAHRSVTMQECQSLPEPV